MRHDLIVEHHGYLYYQNPDYGVRVYAHPIDGWIVGLEYEPTDDLFPGLIYRSRTAWSRDDRLEAAWSRAVDQAAGLWSRKKPLPQRQEKPNPKAYRQTDSIYVPLEG